MTYLQRQEFMTWAYVLPLSVTDRVLSLFLEGLFSCNLHMPSFAKINPSQKYPNLQ